MRTKRIDLPFLVSVIILITAGTLIFWSASLGLVARDSARYAAVLMKQIILGLFPGLLLAYGISRVSIDFWKKHALSIFVGSLILNVLVFVPHIGFSHGGATRWIDLGFTSFQPSELLKIASVIAYAAWLTTIKSKISEWKLGLLPLITTIGLTSLILVIQPDNDTLVVIALTLTIMHVVAKAPWRDVLVFIIIGVIGLGGIFAFRPYVRERIATLISGGSDSTLTSSYQIDQSLIALGSGGVFGRGFGQGIQKFGFLPEPVGDSIFAVAGEEFGLIGTIFIICSFLFFTLRAYTIALKTTSRFPAYALIGLSTSIIIQSFINISSMVGIIPISGIPLVFVSQGGSSLLISLIAVGIMLGLSKESGYGEA